MKNLFTLLIILILNKFIIAQINYEGFVTDNENKQAIEFARVKLIYLFDTLTTSTDLEGHFSFKNIKSNKVHVLISSIYHISLDTAISLSGKRVNYNFKMAPKPRVRNIYNTHTAKENIEKGNPLVLLPRTSFRCFAGPNYEKDSTFESNYKIQFRYLGYVHPISDGVEYNQVIFNYLDKIYGKKWRDEIRTDAIGLKK